LNIQEDMHFKRLFAATLSILLLLFLSCTSTFHDEALKEELQNTYIQFLKALKTGDENIIREAMSSYSYASNKNDYANAKEPFAEKMKEIGETYPALSDLDFIKMYKRDLTTGLLYSKDADSSAVFGRPMLTFIFVKFVKEDTIWKTDAVELIDIEKYNPDGSVVKFEEAFLSDESLIDGNVREAPALIQEAEIAGVLEVFVNGIQTAFLINGLDQGTIDEISVFRLVHGGLKFGENTVEILCEEMPGSTTKSIDVSIKVKANNDFLEVFQYEARKNIQKKYVSKFTVTREIVSKTMTDK
jgi:hypothetical protein